MPFITILTGIILAIVGLVYYFPDKPSITALIPTFLGILFVLLGLVAFKDGVRKHAMHAASALGLIGFVVPAYRIISKYAKSEAIAPAALAEQAIMAGICLVFTALCVNSFIQARRARKREQA